MAKEKQKPHFATIDWTKKSQWDFLDFKHEDMGGANGLRLLKEFAEKQGVIIDYLEYKDYIRFYVIEQAARKQVKNEVKALADEIIQTLNAASPYSVSNQALKREHENATYQQYKKALSYLIDNGIVKKERDEEQKKGRPSMSYSIIT